MKIFAISDLHLSSTTNKPMQIFGSGWDDYLVKIEASWRELVGDDDVVLVSGDISWAMKLQGALPDLDFLGNLPGKKIIIRGNHDYWWQSYKKVCDALPKNVFAIQNNAVKIGNTVFCGTRGWMISEGKSESESKKIFDREFLRLGLTLEAAKKLQEVGDRLVVMLHYPPYEHHGASTAYTDLIAENNANAVVFGHIHGKYSRYLKKFEKNGIPYYLTSCDVLGHKLVEIG